jgi:hypothetical protein
MSQERSRKLAMSQKEGKADQAETGRVTDWPAFVGGLLPQPATPECVARPKNCSSDSLTAAEYHILSSYVGGTSAAY